MKKIISFSALLIICLVTFSMVGAVAYDWNISSSKSKPVASKDTTTLSITYAGDTAKGMLYPEYIKLTSISGCTFSKSQVDFIMEEPYGRYTSTNLSCSTAGKKTIKGKPGMIGIDPYAEEVIGFVTFYEEVKPKPTCTLTSDPKQTIEGKKVTFSWKASNASSIAATWTEHTGVTGSQVLVIEKDGTYTLTAKGEGGTSTCSAKVTVLEKPDPPKLENLNINNQNQLNIENKFKLGEQIKFSGKTIAKGIVHLYFHSEVFEDEVVADEDGIWEYVLEEDLGEGEHLLEIAIEDPETKVLGEKSEPYSFNLYEEEAESPEPVEEKNNIVIWIIFLMTTAVLAGGGFYFYKKYKKKNKKEAKEIK